MILSVYLNGWTCSITQMTEYFSSHCTLLQFLLSPGVWKRSVFTPISSNNSPKKHILPLFCQTNGSKYWIVRQLFILHFRCAKLTSRQAIRLCLMMIYTSEGRKACATNEPNTKQVFCRGEYLPFVWTLGFVALRTISSIKPKMKKRKERRKPRKHNMGSLNSSQGCGHTLIKIFFFPQS